MNKINADGYLFLPDTFFVFPDDFAVLAGAAVASAGSGADLSGGVVVEAFTAGGASMGDGIFAGFGQVLGDQSSISLRTAR